jgi:DNA adenine methylase
MMPNLVNLIPKHTRYVSVFGGSGADILNKPVSRSETWNDLDGHLFNLFSVLKKPKQRKELVGLICLTTYSRQEFREAQKVLHDPASDPVRRAWATVVTGNQIRAGVHFTKQSPSQWGYFRLPSHTLRWPRLPYILIQVANRFRNVIIENLSWEQVFEKYDAPTTLFYCDPPYVHSTRVGAKDQYAHEMTDEDHSRFLDRIQEVEGRVMVSGYDHPLYAEALKHWKRYEFAAVCSISPAKKKPQRTEVVWCNYIVKGVKK